MQQGFDTLEAFFNRGFHQPGVYQPFERWC
jgi:hypothetical protein